MKSILRKIHRWLGLLMALPIIAWMLSGFYFSLYPIEEIRGEHLLRQKQELSAAELAGAVSPERVAAALDEHFEGVWTLSSLTLIRVAGKAAWRAEGAQNGTAFRRLVGRDGTVTPRLDEDRARRVANDALIQPAEPLTVAWVEAARADSEIRGRELPVWKIAYAQPEAVNVYLHPWTGEVVAVRTQRWRWFDFFWMLHILDFESRSDFNHPVLQLAAFLGLLVALSGLMFWALTSRLLRPASRARSGR